MDEYVDTFAQLEQILEHCEITVEGKSKVALVTYPREKNTINRLIPERGAKITQIEPSSDGRAMVVSSEPDDTRIEIGRKQG